MEPESNPTAKSLGGRSIFLLCFLPSEMQVAPSVAEAQTWRRAEREWVRLSDVPRGALPREAVFDGPSQRGLVPLPAAKRVGLLGLSLELV